MAIKLTTHYNKVKNELSTSDPKEIDIKPSKDFFTLAIPDFFQLAIQNL